MSTPDSPASVEPSDAPCMHCEGVQFEGHICEHCGSVAGPFEDSPMATHSEPPECCVCHEHTATQTNVDGYLAFCEFCDPPASEPGHHPVVEPTPADMILASRGELAALEAAKELAEENARLRLIVESTQKELNHTRALLEMVRRESNAAEDDLAEISWICTATGFTGSGDVVDQFEWLLSHLGHGWLASAMRSRRQIQGEIRRQEELLRGLVARVRIGLEPTPQTNDRCLCGSEATKGESEEGFTICNKCFAEEGEE